MPWTPKQFKDRHNKKLTPAQAKVAAEVANQVLIKTADEGRAVREGNAVANKIKLKEKKNGR
jgi:hypothetical protein